jgi:hypothetical protein
MDNGRFSTMFSFAKDSAPQSPKIRLKLLKYIAGDWITKEDYISGYEDPDKDGDTDGNTESKPVTETEPAVKPATTEEETTSSGQSLGVLIIFIVSGTVLIVVIVGGVLLIVFRKKLPHGIAPDGVPMAILPLTKNRQLEMPTTKLNSNKFVVTKLFFWWIKKLGGIQWH